jgi:hypothetical protein
MVPTERYASQRIAEILDKSRLGIIAGTGHLPRQIAERFDPSGKTIFFIALEGITDPKTVINFDHKWAKLGQLQIAMTALLDAKVDKVVMAGPVKRPALSSLKLDKRASKMLLRGGVKVFGDDGLLSLLIKEMEKDGLKVIGIDQILSDLLTEPDLTIGPPVDDIAQKDINRALEILVKLGPADVGQSVAIQEGLVLAIEAIEGTDNMIDRAGQYRRDTLGPILVKISKPGQERRADMPTIGPETVRLAISNGFRGLALEEGGTLLLERDEVQRIAEDGNFFIVGIKVPGA